MKHKKIIVIILICVGILLVGFGSVLFSTKDNASKKVESKEKTDNETLVEKDGDTIYDNLTYECERDELVVTCNIENKGKNTYMIEKAMLCDIKGNCDLKLEELILTLNKTYKPGDSDSLTFNLKSINDDYIYLNFQYYIVDEK